MAASITPPDPCTRLVRAGSGLSAPSHLLLKRLGDCDLHYIPAPAVFEPLAADTLGAAASPADGFDSLLFPVVFDVTLEHLNAKPLDEALLGAAFTAGEFAGGTFPPIAADIKAFQTDGDNNLDVIGGGSATSGGGGSTGGGGGSGSGGSGVGGPPGNAGGGGGGGDDLVQFK